MPLVWMSGGSVSWCCAMVVLYPYSVLGKGEGKGKGEGERVFMAMLFLKAVHAWSEGRGMDLDTVTMH